MIEIDTPLFASLPEEALERIHQSLRLRHFASGELMLSEGELRGELFVLTRGEAVVLGRDWHGEELMLARLRPGECFGEISMLSGEPASATVTAATDADAWVLPHGEFVSIAADHPELARNLSALLAERLRLSNERHLRMQRGQLISLWAPGGPPWGFWLGYRIALSVAAHLREPVTFLDLSGRAEACLRLGPALRSLKDAIKERKLRASVTRGGDGLDCLQVVGVDGADAPAAELLSAIDRLQEQARFVFVFAPEPAAAEAVDRRADSALALCQESELRSAASELATATRPANGQIDLVVVSEQQSAPTGLDYRRARSGLEAGLQVRSIVPGGTRMLEGELEQGSPASRAIDRLARGVAGLRVGLALGGGGAKGYAHIGVVRALERIGVPFDCVTGCSIGAPLAAGVAAGWSLDEVRGHLNSISAKAVRPNVPLVSILTSRSIRSELRALTQERRFEELPTPLGIVAVDIETGVEVLLRSGLVWPAMLASMAYPGIYEPVRIGPYHLVDGGVLNPVPVSAAVSLGADLVISSNLSARTEEGNAPSRSNEPTRRRLIIENIARSLEIMQSKIVEESCNRADVSIEPQFGSPRPGLLDFKRGREFEEAGEEAAERALSKLRSTLPWLS